MFSVENSLNTLVRQSGHAMRVCEPTSSAMAPQRLERYSNLKCAEPGQLPPLLPYRMHVDEGQLQCQSGSCPLPTMVRSEQFTLKSPNDAKLYRLVVLDNGLQELLVHDPEIGQQQQQRNEPAAEPGAAPGRNPLEGSDEDVDSLLSGEEDESCSEV